ncbi:type II toxin-antitoxin system PemK/MazF family toxin [Aneurinibacillus aneurinilyticus]|uniref:type II toxin-antitoxin system PemK/MazF family toxin n=1 Tax=Aneurinibacillus aneurinilyticus TaxID=1391 RepID=UPI003524BDBB
MSGSTKTTFEPGFEPKDLLKQGHVWVAPVWNHTEGKYTPRPIVVVGNDKANDKIGLIINFVTKQGARNEFDVPINYWKEAGLNFPSWVRTAKPTTILKSDLRLDPVNRDGIVKPKGYIGKLHNDDLQDVLTACRDIF